MENLEIKCPKCDHLMNDYEINNGWCSNCNAKYSSSDELKRLFFEKVDEQNHQAEVEIQRQNYAMSRLGLYEYDVETVINEDHGTVDKEKMRQILNDRARKGWKLHTMYSNELGKNALRILGFGMNATACEDVMIFERQLNNEE